MLRLGVLATLACLLLAALAPLPAGAVHDDDLPLVAREDTPDDRAWGLRIDSTATGDIAVDFMAAYPLQSSRFTVGLAFTDAEGNPGQIVAIVFVDSPDRILVAGLPEAGDAALPARVAWSTAATDETCPGACVVTTYEHADPGTRYLVGWVAGATRATMQVRGPAGTSATWTTGAAYGIGDPDLRNGAANAQVQPGIPAGNSVGAKAIAGASAPITAQGRLYGIWTVIDLKIACVGTCVITENAWWAAGLACTPAGAEVCATSGISWSGPGGIGGSANRFYRIGGTPPGAYEFKLDYVADAYVAKPFDLPSYVWLGEHASALTLADVRLP
ncbi:MAG TPA: hypothetical protein VGR28_11155 [Candidatus Thermoplasmatota archaeon]|nr:hypothetical protein [Candidatus Thermoplasmatota archaeon]